MKRLLFSFTLVMSLFSCENQNEKVEYHSDGSIMLRSEMKNGILHGKTTEYYRGGKTIKQIYHYKNGILDGSVKSFYQDGTLEAKGTYLNNEYEGELIHYYPDGSMRELKKFKEGGNLWYLLKLDKNEEIVYNQIVPYFKVDSDTITLGDVFQIDVLFGADIRKETTVYIGYPGEHFSFRKPLDTLQFVGNHFTYQFKPVSEGSQTIGFLFDHDIPEGDSTNLYNIFPKHTFYVKRPPIALR